MIAKPSKEQQVALMKADILYNVLQAVRIQTFGSYIEDGNYTWPANGQEEATVTYFMDQARIAAKKVLLEMSNITYAELFKELTDDNE